MITVLRWNKKYVAHVVTFQNLPYLRNMKGCTECQLFHVTHGNATASTEAWSQIPRTGIFFLKNLDKLTSLIQTSGFCVIF